jgi:hypothetical protein
MPGLSYSAPVILAIHISSRHRPDGVFPVFLRLAAALLAAVSLAPPAHADVWWGGVTCRYAGSSDRTGLVLPDPETQVGVVVGGPWVVLGDPTVFVVSITCTIQVNDSAPGGTGVARQAVWNGNVAFLADTITFQADLAVDAVYICTRVEWFSSKGYRAMDLDTDSRTAGVQCAPQATL